MKNKDVVIIQKKYKFISAHLNEKTRRIWAATEATSLRAKGVAIVSEATGISRTTIYAAINELSFDSTETERIRRTGGGRKRLVDKDKDILVKLEELLEPNTRGDPESPLRWTCKSTRQLAEELTKLGHKICDRTVCDLLSELGYSLQANRKSQEGRNHPDRDAQFQYISRKSKRFKKLKQPVISVDTKKKEMIGNYSNKGKEWQRKGEPINVNTHDFPDPKTPKASPYGVYDITNNKGWVSIGMSNDTAEFAVSTIKKWWNNVGCIKYPHANEIYITCDSGGSNSSRARLWKFELQQLSNDTGLSFHVSHFPPGTSKWNKIEHKMFSFISINWRGIPLTTFNVIVNLIGNTKNNSGLEIVCEMDETIYEKGIKIPDNEFSEINIRMCKFHGEWNYIIKPNRN